MQMIDGLAAFRSAINDNAKTLWQAFFCHLGRDQRQMTQHFFVGLGRVGERVDVLFWDHEKVCGRLRVDIGERDRIVIFENLFGGNFSGDNPTK